VRQAVQFRRAVHVPAWRCSVHPVLHGRHTPPTEEAGGPAACCGCQGDSVR
jgi:hypothetical protein